jgi:isopentenyl-diphosphate delta-isomerase
MTTSTAPPPTGEVVLVAPDGAPLGVAGVLDAHQAPGVLHLAVSAMVRHPDGWILQRRATVKPLFASRWANSCCTHPRPGEAPADAIRRRIGEELGLTVARLRSCGSFEYRAVDPVSGLVEHELDHVFLAEADGPVRPNAEEIAELAFTDLSEARRRFHQPSAAPWSAAVLDLVRNPRHTLPDLR